MIYYDWHKNRINGLNKRLAAYTIAVQDILEDLNKQACHIAGRTGYSADSERPFSFNDYPQTKAAVERLKRQYVSDLKTFITTNTTKEWRNSNVVQDLLVHKVFTESKMQIDGVKRKHLYQTNPEALKAFQNRRINQQGTLSTTLWKQSDDYLDELEQTIGTAIKKGTSAVTLSKQVSKYLQDFDKLKADYKEQYGKAIDVKDCEWRAARLARSEINMAYRTAEQTRWQQMDFVLGYEIQLSKTHTDVDICDELCGRYPKDFVWTGWHPNDKCYAVPILMSEDDFVRWNNGEPVSAKPIEYVPPQFKRWVADNAEKLKTTKSLPYFVKDNKAVVDRYLTKSKKGIDNIESQFTTEQQDYKFDGLKISKEQLENFSDIEQLTGIKRGEPMTIEDADQEHTNPHYKDGFEYKENCQVCTPVYMLRLQGFNVKAVGHFDKGSAWYLGEDDHWCQAWLNKDKTPAQFISAEKWLKEMPDDGKGNLDRMTPRRWRKFIDETTQEPGVYAIGVDWDESNAGHITTLHRFKDGSLKLIDPQCYNKKLSNTGGFRIDLEDIIWNSTRTPDYTCGIMRIDDKLFNTKFIDIFEKP